jgi:exosortase A
MTILQNNKATVPFYLVLLLIATIFLFFETWQSLTEKWILSETYTHGLLVIPGSLWLIWQNKAIHPYLQPGNISFHSLTFILTNGLLWLLASLTHTQVIQQYSLVGILVGSIWYYLGNDNSKKIIFPLFFLYFMVPVGDPLIPYLMEYTATFTIALLRLSGISVHREGMHFSLVSGEWSVVEACSGIRYLIASITLGTIYAYITYTKTYKRAIFILASIVFPIIANGFRAFFIVMLGHLSDMQLAVGVDHVIYGAIFFAIIIFFMFYVGSFWQDPTPTYTLVDDTHLSTTHHRLKKKGMMSIIILVACISFWPLVLQLLQANYQPQTKMLDWEILAKKNDWQEVTPPNWHWRPKFDKAKTDSLRYFKDENNITIGLYQANFGDEKQGAELVNSSNVLRRIHTNPMLNERQHWHFVKQSTLKINSLRSHVDYSLLRNKQINEDMLIFKWYQIGETITNNSFLAKGYQLLKRLTLNNRPEIYWVLFIKRNDPNNKEYTINKLSTVLFKEPHNN